MTQIHKDNQTSPSAIDSSLSSCARQLEDKQLQAGVFTRLPDLARILVSGEDAESFLQGQATCDIRQVNEQGKGFGAFCDPKGRALCTFRIFPVAGGYLLLLAADLQEIICKRLGMFVLRSRVHIACIDNSCDLIVLWGPSEPPEIPGVEYRGSGAAGHQDISREAVCTPDPANPANTSYLLLVPADKSHELSSNLQHQGLLPVTDVYWRLQEIHAGVPHISQFNSGEYVPQMLNLELLGGVSFDKGCYIGQEVIARMHYLGRPSRRTYLVAFRDMAQPLNTGENLFTAEPSDQQSAIAGQVLRSVHVQEEQCCYVQAVLQTSARQAPLVHVATMPGKPFEFIDLPYNLD